MIDTVALLAKTDLRELIISMSGPPPSMGKRVWCPSCQMGDRHVPVVTVRGDFFICHGCGIKGDAISLVQHLYRLDFLEACRYLGWDELPIDHAALEKCQAERTAAREAESLKRAMELDALLNEYSTEEIWLAFQQRMDEDSRTWWENQGVPRDWQEYLRLGFAPDKAYYDSTDLLRHSPAFTIPYFHQGWQFKNMQYRLQDPANPKDRYRFQPGLKTTYYMTVPDDPIQAHIIICEGAKKAMVSKIAGDTGNAVTVLGVPSKSDHAGIAQVVNGCLRAWLVFDPDAWVKPTNAPPTWEPAPSRLARDIGKAARIVRLPFKSDDGFIQFGMTCNEWKATLKSAGKCV
jgi:hypothetical protein